MRKIERESESDFKMFSFVFIGYSEESGLFRD